MADFGASKDFDCISSWSSIGNQKYNAPEVGDENTPCPKADVWSVGVMLLDLMIPNESRDMSSRFSFKNIPFSLPEMLEEYLFEPQD